MKIPRFAFVSMLLLILGLSSGLVVVRARSNGQSPRAYLPTREQPMIVSTLKLPRSSSRWQCSLSANADSNSCATVLYTKDDGKLEASIRLLAKQADRITLGIRTRYLPPPISSGVTVSAGDLERVQPDKYQLPVGGKIGIEIRGLGTAELTVEPLDSAHFFPLPPSPMFLPQPLSPSRGQLRIISPVLLRGQKTVFDIEGATASGVEQNGAIWMYSPGIGRLIVSAVHFPGAVKGHVNMSRINFEINGQRYHLLAGAPITRTQTVWVGLDPNFKSTDPAIARGAIGFSTFEYLLKQDQ